MKKDHARAPIVEAIQAYNGSGVMPFTTPGHKRGRGIIGDGNGSGLGAEIYLEDISMLNGADDRRESKDVQGQAEELAAEAMGADESYFSTNGSSLSAHVAALTVASEGEEILVVRNTHKSMIAALVMSGVRPVFLRPSIDDELDVEHGPEPTHVAEMLDAHPEAKGVFVVSPDYYGVACDVRAIVEECHRRGVPLIVDEAWGPHFPFHPELPTSAMHCGADISFGSIHKTMNGLGQASIINVRGELIDKDRFSLCFDLFETTSASSLILASCDAARRQMVLHGHELWGRAIALGRRARARLADLPGMHVVGHEVLGKPGAFQLDETKLTVDVRGLGLSGYKAADWMLEHHKVTFELIDHRHLMALISVADTEQTVDQMTDALLALYEWATREKPNEMVPLPHHRELGTELVMAPTEAFFAPTRKVKLEEAAGEIIAEMVSPYPPGIPRLIPGERVTETIVDYLRKGRDAGMFVLDPSDTELKTLRVVASRKE
jgi:arginine decarboxylase